MARLLDLADELILAIIAHLQLDAAVRITPVPFYESGERYAEATKRNPSQLTKDLRALLLSCRRLNDLLTPIFYRHICVRQVFGTNPLQQLTRALEHDESLQEYIVSAIVPCWDSILDVYSFFWFANVRTLTVILFMDWEPLEFENESPVGNSPVKTLRLIECGAHEQALAAVLSWPAALEELHYDAHQGEWGGHYEGEPVQDWECAAFVRALQPQKATLKDLTLTRPPLVHEGLFNGPRIDLGDFTALTTLRIYHVFLCGVDDPLEAWRGLPRNLEVLEVYHDDTELVRFQEEGRDDSFDPFLLGVVRHKDAHLPHLRRVAVNSPEKQYNYETRERRPPGPWTPPPSLTREFERAGVELDVWLGYVELPPLGENEIP